MLSGSGSFAVPIALHQLFRPPWLPNLLSGKEFLHDGFDVQYRRSVDCIEFDYIESASFAADDPNDRASDPIGPILAALCEDSGRGPIGVVARVPRSLNDLLRIYSIEEEQHFGVRKLVETFESTRGESLIEYDARIDGTPIIVGCASS